MDIAILLQEGVQTGVVNGAGYVVAIVSIVLAAAWWAHLYR